MTCVNQRGRHIHPGHRVDHTCDRHVPPYPPIHRTTGQLAVAAATLTGTVIAAIGHAWGRT